MSSLLKDIYSPTFFDAFANVAETVIPDFDKERFHQLIFSENWGAKELKDRMKHITEVLHQFLPDDFEKAVELILCLIEKLERGKMTGFSLEFMFFPDYIETYGQEHFEISVRAMERVTQFTSCEFAVRPFILRYGDMMLERMIGWSQHENHHVRRLASEGSRPRLPWAMALPGLKKDPSPALPILENLKDDSSEYVRRSVANHMNDIAKDNPEITLQLAWSWFGKNPQTDALIKHGCRTLLKQGHPEAMQLFGYQNSTDLRLSEFSIGTPVVKSGSYLEFDFSVQNSGNKPLLIRLEYAMYFLRQNGSHSKKVFKISEKTLNAGEQVDISRRQSFKPITTRKYYPGKHRVSVIINGHERAERDFELV